MEDRMRHSSLEKIQAKSEIVCTKMKEINTHSYQHIREILEE